MNWNHQSLTPHSQVYHVWSLLLPVVQPTICRLWDKSSWGGHRGTRPQAGTPACLEPSCTVRLPVSSPSWPARAAATQAGWPCVTGNADLTDICSSTCAGAPPAQFLPVSVFISSVPYFVPTPDHRCFAVWVWSALKHWQIPGFKQAPPAWWSSFPPKSDNQSLKTAPKGSTEFSQFWPFLMWGFLPCRWNLMASSIQETIQEELVDPS